MMTMAMEVMKERGAEEGGGDDRERERKKERDGGMYLGVPL